MPTIAFATKHGKIHQVAPLFEALPEWRIELAELDTDVFGTFSGEIPRQLTPRDAAIEKAKAGAEMLACDYGLGSEGSIGPHPQLPFVTADQEILALVCVSKDFVVVESHMSTDIHAVRSRVTADTDLETLVSQLDLPRHGANIYFTVNGKEQAVKGLLDPRDLQRQLQRLLEQSAHDVTVESDFRAMNSPTRQANIRACAEKLVLRMSSLCPACGEIGWGKVGYLYGLPCTECRRIVMSAPHSEQFGCVRCEHKESVALRQTSVDAARCDFCNP